MKLTQLQIDTIALYGKEISFPAGKILIHNSTQAESLYIVRSGRLRVFFANTGGKEFTVDVIHKGDLFGDNAFLAKGYHTVSIETVTDTKLIVCDTGDILSLAEKDSGLMLSLLQYFIDLNNHLTHLVETLTLYTAEEKVMDFLLTATEEGTRTIPYTHENVAACLSMNRVTVSKIMKKLCDEHTVESQYGLIRITDPIKLRNMLNKAK